MDANRECEGPLYGKIPKDRITLSGWCRSFFLLNPIVSKAILFHATYSIRMFRTTPPSCFYLDVAKDLNLIEKVDDKPGFWRPGQVLADMSKEYWALGEVFPYLELDDDSGVWNRIVIQNPDYIFVKRAILDAPEIQLRPDAVLKHLVASKDPADAELKGRLPQQVVECVAKNENIPLDVFNISHIKRLATPYDIRGTSIMLSVLKDLMLYDSLREQIAAGCGDSSCEACLRYVSSSICRGLLFSPGSLMLIDNQHGMFRHQISDWLIDKVFRPLSKMQDSRNEIVPAIEWQPASTDELLAVLNDA